MDTRPRACTFPGGRFSRATLALAVRGHWFASVVSMIPGVFLFRMASGLIQLAEGSHTTLELISATIADGMTALAVILAMSLGLIAPKMAIDRISERLIQAKS